MPKTFNCCHCGKSRLGNPRLKGRQKYCGQTICQQVRKNSWERNKLRGDREYKIKREASKKAWYARDHQGADYQSRYRKAHPKYVEQNRQNQVKRNQKHQETEPGSKIVKTDALGSQSIDTQGLYVLLPWRKRTGTEKIVKTDTFVVQVVDKVPPRHHLVPRDG